MIFQSFAAIKVSARPSRTESFKTLFMKTNFKPFLTTFLPPPAELLSRNWKFVSFETQFGMNNNASKFRREELGLWRCPSQGNLNQQEVFTPKVKQFKKTEAFGRRPASQENLALCFAKVFERL